MEPESAQGLEGTARALLARVPHSDGVGRGRGQLELRGRGERLVIKTCTHLRVL